MPMTKVRNQISFLFFLVATAGLFTAETSSTTGQFDYDSMISKLESLTLSDTEKNTLVSNIDTLFGSAEKANTTLVRITADQQQNLYNDIYMAKEANLLNFSADQIAKLNTAISNLTSLVVSYDTSNFNGKLKFLNDSIDQYANIKNTKDYLAKLVADKRILSPQEIFGSTDGKPVNYDKTKSKIWELINRRCEADLNEFIDSTNRDASGNLLASDGKTIDPISSWPRIVQLIDSIKTAFTNSASAKRGDDFGIIATDLSKFCQACQDALDKPITTTEKVAALESIINAENLKPSKNSDLGDTKYSEFKNKLKFIINGLISSDDKTIRDKISGLANSYLNKYGYSITTDPSLSTILQGLQRTVLPSDLFADGDLVFLKNSSPSSTDSYLSLGSTSYLMVADGIYNAVVFKVQLDKDMLILVDANSATSSQFLTIDVSSQCKMDGLAATASANSQKFYVFGDKNRLSLQSVNDLGFVTICADGFLRTKNNTMSAVFTALNQDGSLNQNSQNSFQAIVVSAEIKKLIDNHKANLPDDTSKFTTTNITNFLTTWYDLAALIPSKSTNSDTTFAQKVLDELSNLLQYVSNLPSTVTNKKDLMNLLRVDPALNQTSFTGTTQQKTDDILASIETLFTKELKTDAALASALDKVKQKWTIFKTINPDVAAMTTPDWVSKLSATIAIAATISNAEKNLSVRDIKNLDNQDEFEIYASTFVSSDAQTHFKIQQGLSSIGLEIVSKPGYFLKVDVESINQNKYWFVAEPLAESSSFDDQKNASFHFLIEDAKKNNNSFYVRPKAYSDYRFQIDSNSPNEDLNLVKAQDAKAASGDIKSQAATGTIFSFSEIPAFVLSVSKINNLANDAAKLSEYIRLLDFATTADELKQLFNSYIYFLQQKRTSFDTWSSFITITANFQALSDFYTRADTLIKKSFASNATLPGLLKTIDSLDNKDFAESIKQLVGQQIVIQWTDSSGKIHYLQKNNTTKTVGFYADAATFDTSFMTLTETVAGSGKYFIQFNDKTYLTKEEKTAGGKTIISYKFAAEPITNQTDNRVVLSMQGDFHNAAFLNENLEYLTVKTSTFDISFAQGTKDSNNNSQPIPTIQQFSLRAISTLEKDLAIANKLFSADDATWTNYASDNVWSDTDNMELSIALGKIVSKFDSMAQGLISSGTTDADKKLFIGEIFRFVSDVTTKLDGHIYTEMLSDRNLLNQFEQGLMQKVDTISQSSEENIKLVNTVKSLWTGGYSGSNAFKTGSVIYVSTTVNGAQKYVSLDEKIISGQTITYLKLSDKFDQTTLFKVTSYKASFALESVAKPGMFWSIDSLGNQATTKATLEKFDSTNLDNSSNKNSWFYVEDGKIKTTEKDKVVGFAKDASNMDYSTTISNLNVKVASAVETKIIEAYSKPVAIDALQILIDLLKQNYLLTKDDFADFEVGAKKLFADWKSSGSRWKDLSSNVSFLAKIDEFKAEITNESQNAAELLNSATNPETADSWKARYFNLVSQDVSADFATEDDTFVVVYTTAENNQLYLSRDVIASVPSFDGSADKGKYSTACQFKIKKDSATGNVLLYCMGLDDNKKNIVPKYLFINTNDTRMPIALLTDINSAAKFTVGAMGSKVFFKSNSSFLTADPNKDDLKKASIIPAPGVTGSDGVTRPIPSYQGFDIVKLDRIDLELAKINDIANDSSVKDKGLTIINAYSALSSQDDVAVNASAIERILSQIDNFVTTNIVASQKSFNDFQNNKKAVSALTLLLNNLAPICEQVKLSSQLDEIIKTWESGFATNISKFAPIDKDIVLLVDENTRNVIRVVESFVEGNSIINFAATSDDYIDQTAFFRVARYKDKFGFESVAKPGVFFKAPTVEVSPTDQKQNQALRIQGQQLIDSKNAGITKFGLDNSIPFQFTLDQGMQSGFIDTLYKFRIKSVQQNSALIIDADDFNALRTENVKINPSTTTTVQNIMIWKVRAIHSALQRTMQAADDLSIVNGLNDIIDKNFVTDKESAVLLATAVKKLLFARSESKDLWASFVGNQKITAAMKTLITKMAAIKSLASSADEIKKIFYKGFSDQLKDGDYIIFGFKKAAVGKAIKIDANKNIIFDNDTVLGGNAIFRIKTVNYQGKDYLQFVYEMLDTTAGSADQKATLVDYVLKINDTTNSRTKASIEALSSINTDDKLKTTLFSSQGSSDGMSFLSLKSGSYLTFSADNELSTRTVVSGNTSKPAGVMLQGILSPSAMETFTVQVLTSTEKALKQYSTPSEIVSFMTGISGLVDYPTFYQRERNENLKDNDDEKKKYYSAIDTLVTTTVSNQRLAQAALKDGLKPFQMLMGIATDLDPSVDQKQTLETISQKWLRGYAGAAPTSLPADGTVCLVFVKETSTSSSSSSNRNMEESSNNAAAVSTSSTYTSFFKKYPRLVQVVKDANSANMILAIPRPEGDLSKLIAKKNMTTTTIQNRIVSTYDPFDSKNWLTIIVSGDTIGFKSDTAKLTIDLAQTDENTASNKAPIVTLNADKFYTDFDTNTQHFVPRGNSTDGFNIMHVIDQCYISVSDTTGKLTVFNAQGSRLLQANDNPPALTENETFYIVPITDCVKEIAKTRKQNTNQDKINTYNSAISKISNLWDLRFVVDELARLVESRKVSKDTWANFISATGFTDALKEMIKGITTNYSANDAFSLDATMTAKLNELLSFINQEQSPQFDLEIETNETILSVSGTLDQLKTRLQAITSKNSETFIADLEKLATRRVELSLTDFTSTQDSSLYFAQSTIANWIESEVVENLVIQQANLADRATAVVDKLRSDFSYSEFADYAKMMMSVNLFSESRARWFVQAISQASNSNLLKIAFDQKANLENVRVAIRQVVANQLKPFLDRTLTANGISYAKLMQDLLNSIKYNMKDDAGRPIKDTAYISAIDEVIVQLTSTGATPDSIADNVSVIFDLAKQYNDGINRANFSQFGGQLFQRINNLVNNAKTFGIKSKMVSDLTKLNAELRKNGASQGITTSSLGGSLGSFGATTESVSAQPANTTGTTTGINLGNFETLSIPASSAGSSSSSSSATQAIPITTSTGKVD